MGHDFGAIVSYPDKIICRQIQSLCIRPAEQVGGVSGFFQNLYQPPAVAERVQIDSCLRFHSKFIPKIPLPYQDLANKRFPAGQVAVGLKKPSPHYVPLFFLYQIPDTVKELEPTIRQFVIDHVEAMKSKAADGEEVDLVQAIASPLPTMVVADILGVPPEDREKFDPWSDAITSASADFTLDVQQAIGAVQGLVTYFGGMCQARRANPTGDMISKLTQAEVDGETLTDWDILGFCFVMIAGGNDTTTNLIGNSMKFLHENPDQHREMLEDPSLIPNAIEEFLRIESVVQGLSRTTTEDVEYYGTTIPAGSKVHNLYASGNRDPRHWGNNADQLDIHREIDRHLSFAQGPHFCIGAHVARLMVRSYFEEMGSRIGENFEIDWDRAERRYSAFTRGFTKIPIHIKA